MVCCLVRAASSRVLEYNTPDGVERRRKREAQERKKKAGKATLENVDFLQEKARGRFWGVWAHHIERMWRGTADGRKKEEAQPHRPDVVEKHIERMWWRRKRKKDEKGHYSRIHLPKLFSPK